jgi:hypothetical protein
VVCVNQCGGVLVDSDGADQTSFWRESATSSESVRGSSPCFKTGPGNITIAAARLAYPSRKRTARPGTRNLKLNPDHSLAVILSGSGSLRLLTRTRRPAATVTVTVTHRLGLAPGPGLRIRVFHFSPSNTSLSV